MILSRRFPVLIAACAAALLAGGVRPGPALADGCISYAYDNGTIGLDYLWPNWVKAQVTSIDFDICQCGFVSERFTGLTIVNFGTAQNGDFKGIYAQFSCANVNSGLLTLTYGG